MTTITNTITVRYTDRTGRTLQARAERDPHGNDLWRASDGLGRELGIITAADNGRCYSNEYDPIHQRYRTGNNVDDTVPQALKTLLAPVAIRLDD